MLRTAVAPRRHGAAAGGPAQQLATGDWQIAHVASLLEEGSLATGWARRSLATAAAEGWSGWRLASAHEGMARARAATGDDHGRRTHLAAAEQAVADEPDPAERAVIQAQVGTVPEAAQTL